MKERPILFSAPMVRAVLEGRKTQTRRIVTPAVPDGVDLECIPHDVEEFPDGRWHARFVPVKVYPDDPFYGWRRCPYGQPGAHLWVREVLRGGRASALRYDADDLYVDGKLGPAEWRRNWRKDEDEKIPAIHMPRWASRLTLELTEVRIERLQAITESDALAEGITGPHMVGYPAYRIPDDSKPRYSGARAAFESAWDHLNADRAPWASNPWVWVLTFRRLDSNDAHAPAPRPQPRRAADDTNNGERP